MQLLNRQKRAKKTPIPLTNDMLNELKVNHMGGADNYGVDDFYNIDDPWNDTKQPIKPKVKNRTVWVLSIDVPPHNLHAYRYSG